MNNALIFLNTNLLYNSFVRELTEIYAFQIDDDKMNKKENKTALFAPVR